MDPQWAFDPTRTYAYRYWDGTTWTAFVSDGRRSWRESAAHGDGRTASLQAPPIRRGHRIRLSA